MITAGGGLYLLTIWHFPLPVVIGHGSFATVTIVLVVLTALDVTGS
jgi:hypothetical protein